jgi:sulfite exporter TauE/SafE
LTESLSFLGAFLLGLLGSTHCIGMCGGIMGALSMGIKDKSAVGLSLLTYNLGRITSYAFFGALLGATSWLATEQLPFILVILRILAAALLILMGLYLGNWWFGLTKLEQAGHSIWRHIQPFGKKYLPVQHPHQAFVLGMIWGWLPCGLVYSTAALAASQANPVNSALVMAAFGLGTLPALLATGMAAAQFKAFTQQPFVRKTNAVIIIGFGILTLFSAITLATHHS